MYILYSKIVNYCKPLLFFFNNPSFIRFLDNLSKIPFMNTLLFLLEYSLAISKYSFIETFTGIDLKYKNSERHICKRIKSI